jgi:hypothetical protein
MYSAAPAQRQAGLLTMLLDEDQITLQAGDFVIQ